MSINIKAIFCALAMVLGFSGSYGAQGIGDIENSCNTAARTLAEYQEKFPEYFGVVQQIIDGYNRFTSEVDINKIANDLKGQLPNIKKVLELARVATLAADQNSPVGLDIVKIATLLDGIERFLPDLQSALSKGNSNKKSLRTLASNIQELVNNFKEVNSSIIKYISDQETQRSLISLSDNLNKIESYLNQVYPMSQKALDVIIEINGYLNQYDAARKALNVANYLSLGLSKLDDLEDTIQLYEKARWPVLAAIDCTPSQTCSNIPELVDIASKIVSSRSKINNAFDELRDLLRHGCGDFFAFLRQVSDFFIKFKDTFNLRRLGDDEVRRIFVQEGTRAGKAVDDLAHRATQGVICGVWVDCDDD